MTLVQRLFKAILPKGAADDMEAASRRWMMRCPDGHQISMWDAGGVRFGAAGKPRRLFKCRECGKLRWMELFETKSP